MKRFLFVLAVFTLLTSCAKILSIFINPIVALLLLIALGDKDKTL